MIRDRLRRWTLGGSPGLPAPDADPSQVRLYTAPWILPGNSAPIRDGAVVMQVESGEVLAVGPRDDVVTAWNGSCAQSSMGF